MNTIISTIQYIWKLVYHLQTTQLQHGLLSLRLPCLCTAYWTGILQNRRTASAHWQFTIQIQKNCISTLTQQF